ncbi:hypothetical protein F5141DRAFT_1201524 [Pisolithus sp. B1]|nr:hypothetical protein F5141DRAFT_1201524 [Pisolithus sp. B1]
MMDIITSTTVAAMRSIYYHSLATLALSFWDFLMTIEEEVRYIWPMKKRHAFKWLYIFLRHFLLVVQITCQIAFRLLPVVSPPASHDYRTLLIVMAVLVECAHFTLEFILAFRVFALFGGRPWVSRLLGCLILVEIICCTPITLLGFKNLGGGGILFQLSPDANIQMVFTIVVHSAFVFLTVAKRTSIAGARGIGRDAITQFMRDGTVTYFMMAGLIGLALATFTGGDIQPIILFFWALTVYSICGSRLILGMACIQDHMGAPREDENVLLTTHIDVCPTEDLD